MSKNKKDVNRLLKQLFHDKIIFWEDSTDLKEGAGREGGYNLKFSHI